MFAKDKWILNAGFVKRQQYYNDSDQNQFERKTFQIISASLAAFFFIFANVFLSISSEAEISRKFLWKILSHNSSLRSHQYKYFPLEDSVLISWLTNSSLSGTRDMKSASSLLFTTHGRIWCSVWYNHLVQTSHWIKTALFLTVHFHFQHRKGMLCWANEIFFREWDFHYLRTQEQ